MLRLVFIFLSLSFLCLASEVTLQYSRLVPGHTKFSLDSAQGIKTLTFQGFTVDGNLVCLDGVNFFVFERPSFRDSPDDEKFADWYNLNLMENTLGLEYNPEKNDLQYSQAVLTNNIIFGPDAVVSDCRFGQVGGACKDVYLNDVLRFLLLRGGTLENDNLANPNGLNLDQVLLNLTKQNADFVPVAVVGGGVRDFETNRINDINDIDVAIAQDYKEIAYRLKDIFVEWNQPIDSSVLDQKGIRQTFGLLKVRPQLKPGEVSCKERNVYTEAVCFGDGLDIGPFKAGAPKDDKDSAAPLFPLKYSNGKAISDSEKKNHYIYAYSYSLDRNFRDFTINCIYYDYLGQTFIDPTGFGIADSTASPAILRIADDLTACDSMGCNWRKDLGGWFRIWRFLTPNIRNDPNGASDGKGYTLQPSTVAETHVCKYLIKTMCKLIDTGYDEYLDYTVLGFFEKFRKKRDFQLGNVQAILNPMRDQMFLPLYNSKNSGNCPNAWHMLTKLAASDQARRYLHLLEGTSSTQLTIEIINYLASVYDASQLPNDFCSQNSLTAKRALPPLQPAQKKDSSIPKQQSQSLQNFQCFMREYILSGRSYQHSSLVISKDNSQYDYLQQANPLYLDDNFYPFEQNFEDQASPIAMSRYPRFTDLEIRSSLSLHGVAYVHKLVLMMVYPRVYSLDESSDLGVFVQSLLDGDEENLKETSIIVTDVEFADLVQELSDVYSSSEFEALFNDLRDWREAVSRSEEPMLTQWNQIGSSRIVTSENEQIAVSRFFLASFCYLDGVEELSLLSLTKYLMWEMPDGQSWVLPSAEVVNDFLNLLVVSGTSGNSDTQLLLEQALSGNSFCSYKYTGSDVFNSNYFSPASSSNLEDLSSTGTSLTSAMFCLLLFLCFLF